MIGGGGSTLAVPIRVFVAGLQARDTTSKNRSPILTPCSSATAMQPTSQRFRLLPSRSWDTATRATLPATSTDIGSSRSSSDERARRRASEAGDG
jgi:hypothetical protein